MKSVKYEPLIALLDAHGKDSGHRWNSCRQKHAALPSENEVKVLILAALPQDMVSLRVLFFHEVDFELFQFFETYKVLISKMRDKAHEEFNLLN